jgi:hypothetical protein
VSAALLLAVAALAAGAAQSSSGASYLVVVAGVGGEPRARDAFHEQAVALATVAEKQIGLPAESVWCLTEKPDRAPAVIDGRSTREAIEQAFSALAERSRAGDLVLVVLIGHGSHRSGEDRFNLPGPDMTPADFGALLDRLPGRRVVLVNTASASGGWVAALSAEGRVIVTATKSGMERNQTVFGRFFVDALTGDGADVDKDGRVSVLEAFEFARREVARFYEAEGRLQTEHALLDDDGDGEGSGEPEPGSGDGGLARLAFLAPAAGAGSAEAALEASDDPALAALLAERAALEARLEGLKARRDALPAADYDAELEELLVELSLKSEAIRQASGQPQ